MKGLGSLVAIAAMTISLAGCGGAVSTSSSEDPDMPDPTPPGEGTPEATPQPTSAPSTAPNLRVGNWFVSKAANTPADAYEPNDAQARYLGGSGFLYTLTQGRIEPIEAIVTAEVTNDGDADAPASVADLFLDRTSPPAANERGAVSANVPDLPSGASTSIAFTLRGGTQAVTRKAAVKVDALSALAEHDESDNLSPNVDVTLPRQDEDWFSFDEASGRTVEIRLTNLPADYDLELYYQNGARVGVSATGGTAAESITYATTVSGRWYVRVFGYQGAADANTPYRLEVTVP